MILAHVVLNLNIGGLERVVVNLVKGFQSSPYRCVVCCLEEGGPFASEIRSMGVDVKVFAKRDGIDWRCVRRLAKYFRDEDVRIVHTHNAASHFHGVAAAVAGGVRARVHTKHGRDYPDDRRKVLLNRLLSWGTDEIVTVSDDARDVVVQVEKVNPRKVRRIWNGVDTELYRPPDRIVAEPVIGTVARLSPEKDQRTLLTAFKLVRAELPDARLVLVGDGSEAADLARMARDLGISDQVDFLGPRSDVSEILHTFSVFTLTSTTEGISMTVLEAMAAGLPIVATDVGGNREIVAPPACGLIVPPGDPEALSRAYLELLADAQRRGQIGRNARRRAVEHFSLNQMIAEYAKVYSDVLNHP